MRTVIDTPSDQSYNSRNHPPKRPIAKKKTHHSRERRPAQLEAIPEHALHVPDLHPVAVDAHGPLLRHREVNRREYHDEQEVYDGEVHEQLEVGGAEGPAEVVGDEFVQVDEEDVALGLVDFVVVVHGRAGAAEAASLAEGEAGEDALRGLPFVYGEGWFETDVMKVRP